MSHSHSNKKCKSRCSCLRVPYNPHATYSVERLGDNPIAVVKTCKCCCKVKQHPFKQTVVTTPLPVSSF
jgi:hypothetical protein